MPGESFVSNITLSHPTPMTAFILASSILLGLALFVLIVLMLLRQTLKYDEQYDDHFLQQYPNHEEAPHRPRGSAPVLRPTHE